MKFAIIGALIASVYAGDVGSTTVRPVTYTVQSAVVSGKTFSTHRAFLGIPYAKAPIGTLRFAEPVAAPTLTGTKDFSKFGNSCFQFSTDKSRIGTPESEDCLNLNVYVPIVTDTPNALDVIVWIHGGSLTTGSSSNPKELMDNFPNDSIKVSINYRLGAFGFLPGSDTTTSRNAGLLDQKMALEWINANIGSFGGNPNRITVVGESAGATSIGAHMLAQGGKQTLFQQAILLSAPFLLMPLNTTAENLKRAAIGATVGCTSTNSATLNTCLRSVPAAKFASCATDFFYIPSVDYNRYLYTDAFTSIKTSAFSKIPTLLHVNANEGSVFGLVASDAEAKALRRWQFPFFTETMHKKFDATYPYTGPQSGGDLFADILFYCPAAKTSQLFTSLKVPIYNTFNTHRNVFRPFGNSIPSYIDIGVAHTSEMPHFFQYFPEIAANETVFSQRVQKTFLDFARNPTSLTPYGTARNRLNLETAKLEADGAKDAKCKVIEDFLNALASGQTVAKRDEIYKRLAELASGNAQFTFSNGIIKSNSIPSTGKRDATGGNSQFTFSNGIIKSSTIH